jgi:hypothetical protein
MSVRRKTALVALAAGSLSLGGSLWFSPVAFAGDASSLDGHYLLTFSANQKSGTSMAARQPEYVQRTSYSFSSSCSTGVCVATVNDPQPPKNQYLQQSVQYTWNGSRWVQQMTGKWDCSLLGGLVEHDPARSTTVLVPGPNGVLTGVSHTEIVSGACRGTVDMPVSATPESTPVI